MTVECAYRSTHPSVVEWWADIDVQRHAFGKRCNEVADRFPGFRAVTMDRHHGSRLAGIVGYEDEEAKWGKRLLPPPSDAWRLVDKDLRHYVPYKNHRKDPDLLALFEGASWKMTMPPGGMPLKVLVGARWFMPGMRSDDDGQTIWVSWGVGSGYIDPDPELASKVSMRQSPEDRVDPSVWESVKLSDYYLAIEAAKEGAA